MGGGVVGGGDAGERWAAELAAWRIEEEILAAAPESPYGCPPALFRAPPTAEPWAQALEVLPLGGTVLDVGCGGGAVGLPLAPPAALVVGVDRSPGMLEEFARAAAELGVRAQPIEGRWPEVADRVPDADVVVCGHVAYDVPDLATFARALAAHARRRVVLELTAVHPWVPLGPLWEHFHGSPRPAGPTAELAAEVLAEAGFRPSSDRRPSSAARPLRGSGERAARVAFTRRRLCLPVEREPEVARLLEEDPPRQVDVVRLWWDTAVVGPGLTG